MKFLCGRPGCGEDSIATLQIDAISNAISLIDPRVSRDGIPLCQKHADLTTPPVGWAMNDLRSKQTLSSVPTGEDIPTKVPKSPNDQELLDDKPEENTTKKIKNNKKDSGSANDQYEMKVSSALQKRISKDKSGPSSRPSKRRELDEDRKNIKGGFPWNHQFEDDEEPKELHADSPLLSRAFRSSVG